MSNVDDIYALRKWMYNRIDPVTGETTREYQDGLRAFVYQATNNPIASENGNIFCPCIKCRNTKFVSVDLVKRHLYNRGFMPGYWIWFSHGEGDSGGAGSSSLGAAVDHQVRSNAEYGTSYQNMFENYQGDRFHDMVTDAFHESMPTIIDSREEPNVEAKQFYAMLDAANQPIYEGCREGLSKLSLASRMMTIKSDNNLSENCMNAWSELLKEYLPEDNLCAGSYYEIQKFVAGLGLPSETIDVCIDNCMIFWRNDAKLEECRFCGKARYRPSSGRTRVPFQRMWYLPITDRLKRLYHSERTSGAMRWHAEHRSEDGEITHPSDAKAWKHFQMVHPGFANESRNVYLGLCTDGFSPFGMSGRQYSLWPVILTPYNLPPDMCMQREFLFMSILIPGPKHPKRSLDVFLQPLIEELNQLWHTGVHTYDYSQQQNFNMRAVLLWTISDFPAYGMLSGWTTHGRLSCPYCRGESDAFQLKHGRKACWFDCHRRFLPMDHPYRRNKKLFTKKKVVRVSHPVYLSGDAILEEIDYYGALETSKMGGNWHSTGNMPDGYGDSHNWHKRSIFWDLPYWKDHLLRHNLDVMHIEKNFFDNIMNTVMNVQGKSKDNVKSRKDLVDICERQELHITSDGKMPIPLFRLSGEAKQKLFDWVASDVKFPDGYVSNFSRCIDEQGKKFSGMKSHDCHVFMQQLLPFVFLELLPGPVHEAIAGIGAFFRDLCTRTLTEDGIDQLHRNIPVLLCNLEKIFPPSFFDVMEHLPIHLPHEAALGGPVQFRWMYPFERYMGHLKGKAKNLARVEGSIVAGSLTEETSHFTSFYFSPTVRTKKSRLRRYNDGGVAPTYPVDVPDIFSQIGRFGGKCKEVWWEDEDHCHAAHTYILRNCDFVHQFESEFDAQIRQSYPDLEEVEYERLKDREFAGWLKFYVKNGYANRSLPLWLHEIVEQPLGKIQTGPMYFTRGFTFQTVSHCSRKATANFGIHVPGETDYYGVLQEIVEVTFPGCLNLKCVLLKCDWFDPTRGRGVRNNAIGITDVNANRKFSKFEPFVLASQAEQVCFISYPRLRDRREKWYSVIKVNPRGRIVGDAIDVPLQDERSPGRLPFVATESTADIYLVNPRNPEVEDIFQEADQLSEEELDEFDESGEEDDIEKLSYVSGNESD